MTSVDENAGTSVSAMERLLKQVFALHKDALRGVTATLIKYKTACQRAEEKRALLERSIVDLVTENRQLKSALTLRGDSVSSVIDIGSGAKDIHVLGRSGALDQEPHSSHIGDKDAGLKEKQNINTRQDEASSEAHDKVTSKPVEDKTYAGCRDHTDVSLECSDKLRLKKTKRSRYSEDVSPEKKMPRRNSPEQAGQSKERKADPENLKVLVPDTCAADMNETLKPVHLSLDNRNIKVYECGLEFAAEKGKTSSVCRDSVGHIEKEKSIHNDSILVVPETLGIEMGETADYVDSEDELTLKPKLGTIAEESQTESQQRGSNGLSEKLPGLTESIGSKDFGGVNKCVENIDDPEKQKCLSKEETLVNDDQDSSCDSIVKSSDDEGDSCSWGSQKFTSRKVSRSGLDRFPQNFCRNMKEVNELFETPKSKTGTAENSTNVSMHDVDNSLEDEHHSRVNTALTQKLKNSDREEVILRRSPRKHKSSLETKNTGSPSKMKQQLCRSKRSVIKDADRKTASVKEADNYGLDTDNRQHLLNETMKSPSILNDRNDIPKGCDVISINSSAVSSSSKTVTDTCQSDVDSPLLTKTTRRVGSESDVQLIEDRWMRAGRRRISLSAQGKSLSASRLPRDKIVNKTDTYKDKAKKKKPGLLQQTTLTQGFFSPKKNSPGKKRSPLKSSPAKKTPSDDASEANCSTNEASGEGHIEDHVFRKPLFRRPSKLSRSEVKQVPSIDLTGSSYDDAGVLREIDNQMDSQEGRQLNQSVDPAAELSEWCNDPPTLPSLDVDFTESDLGPTASQGPRTSTLAQEDTQDIPCSSASHKFGPRKKPAQHLQNVENIPPDSSVNPNDSFDRPPRKRQGPEIAHEAVVRKKEERQKLQGHGCKQCVEYYKSAGRTDEEVKQHMHQCSRHRAQYVRPDTPPHFWSVGFIDTQDLPDPDSSEEKQPEVDTDASAHRRRRRLNKYFKAKHEKSTVEDDLCFE